ncbi:flavin reductase (DIM6/NTAB) family NADH-FMN oxidoreductase RutF [Winogradskyella wandonensis]|uniref:Flavin reductase (DIM6/NTAB) family NADH-FMN oxidoreductase RutF n=1 Tax=Winogradskyella wandonensis TaxID=1442586 RepID=A0A4R1KN37_9FLAO|nr:flavin reductase family protein [Winogradskyella wandonensis]TCK65109.1 flavin reductase (DIM6/NTAB) family NADH-FMN oxidoreductase RutF [Winogradskyella wandonensis]
MISFEPKDLSTAKLHGYLLSAVAPRPIAFASTIDADGNPNLSPFSFFNVFSANPPILIFSPARRVRDNTTKHTLENVEAVKEVVINTVNYAIVQQMSLSSTEYPVGVNEFDKAGLTMLQSDLVKPFRVAESPIQLECKVNKIINLGTEGGAGNLVICEVLKLHILESVIDKEGRIDQEQLDLVARAGGSYYSRAKDGFFEIPKPLTTLGIGVDKLPESVRKSSILTGNDLGILGNLAAFPSDSEIEEFLQTSEEFSNVSQADFAIDIIHKRAKSLIENKEAETALLLLMAKEKLNKINT